MTIRRKSFTLGLVAAAGTPVQAWASTSGPAVLGIPLPFLLFGLTLLGVAILHRHALRVALTGLALITGYKLLVTDFAGVDGLPGLVTHLLHEWVILVNLLGLLLGFTLLARHFEQSRAPELLPGVLPDDWRGGMLLLAIVFALSGFLDNIAAAIIGASMAATVFRGQVHVAYLAAIVAASNAGGAGSVVGDTTTTMMWVSGVRPSEVIEAYLPAAVALVVVGVPASLRQQRHAPITKDPPAGVRLDHARLVIVALVLTVAIMTNVSVNLLFSAHAEDFPYLGAALWITLLACAAWRAPDWSALPASFRGSVFLLSLVLSASMMPVEQLPAPSVLVTLGLGFVSAVFDNIPLTKLALERGGYDWGFLAYAVGFGGSMVWFGSSAGVAVASRFAQARSVGAWLRHAWYLPIAYVAGYVTLWLVRGWSPAG